MSKADTEPPERLSATGATDLERRLLEAASREAPTRELSERMARGIGVALPLAGSRTDAGPSTGRAAPKVATASSSLLPWITGALVATVVSGIVVALRPRALPSAPSASAVSVSSVPVATSALAAPAATPRADTPPAGTPDTAGVDTPPNAPTPTAFQPSRAGATAGDLAKQIALVDAARTALAGGGAARALSIVRDYQAAYPTGTFRPEVAAIKIEALVKLGRTVEARTSAERFVAAYGPSPLADRVARLAGLPQQ